MVVELRRRVDNRAVTAAPPAGAGPSTSGVAGAGGDVPTHGQSPAAAPAAPAARGRGRGRPRKGAGRGRGRPPPSGTSTLIRRLRTLHVLPGGGAADGHGRASPEPAEADDHPAAARSIGPASPALHAFAATAPFWVPTFVEAARDAVRGLASAVGVKGGDGAGAPFPVPPPAAWARLGLPPPAPRPDPASPALRCAAALAEDGDEGDDDDDQPGGGGGGGKRRRRRPKVPLGAPALNFLPGGWAGALPAARGGGGPEPGAHASARPPPVRFGGPGRAVALGPGGGRPLVPGRDVLVTVSLAASAAGAAGGGGRLLAELVFLAGTPLTAVRDALGTLCPCDAALGALGVGVRGAVLHVEGVLYDDDRASAAPSSGRAGAPSPPPADDSAWSRPPDYAAPIVAWAARAGLRGPPPPAPGGGAEAPVPLPPGRKRRARFQPALGSDQPRPPFRRGDLSRAGLGWAFADGGGGGGGSGGGGGGTGADLPPGAVLPPGASPTPLRAGGGAGYVFAHQGGCEHAVAVRDVRLVVPADVAGAGAGAAHQPAGPRPPTPPPPTTGDFPLLTFKARPAKRRVCSACGVARAAKVTAADPHAPAVPAFWCGPCYEAFHYSAEGRLLYDHRVADYHGG